MEKGEPSPRQPGEDWTQWEVVDVQGSPKQKPKEGSQDELLVDDRKEGSGSAQQNKDQHGSQQQPTNKRHNNKNNKEEGKSNEGSVASLMHENEEMKKKLSDLLMEREREKERQAKREDEFLQALERSKLEQLKVQIEKDQLKKERENIQRQKELIEKERKELLLLQKKQQQSQQQQYRDHLSAFDINAQSNASVAHAAHAKSPQSIDPGQDESIGWLTVDGVLNDKEWAPCVEQKYGWVLHNHSGKTLTFKAKLERVGDRQDIKICEEGALVEYQVDKDSELEIVVHARAPALCGKYVACWKLVGEDKKDIGPHLEMKLIVKSDLGESKEKLVVTLTDMGFGDREAVIAVLTANKWDLNAAMQQLMEQ